MRQPNTESLRYRRARAFSRIAEDGYEQRFEADAEWSDRLERDHDDFRAALDWLAKRDPDAELRLASAFGWFWLSHSLLAEGRRRLTSALKRPTPRGACVRAP